MAKKQAKKAKKAKKAEPSTSLEKLTGALVRITTLEEKLESFERRIDILVDAISKSKRTKGL